MTLGTSPYNFVPLNEHIYFPEWVNQISMDIPFEDGEDGVIEVEWTNDSPLFIRDVQNPDDTNSQENQYSMHIMNPDGTRLYFLPGSSLRGMLRNVLSILSFGKMNQFTNRFYGHREFDTKNSNNTKYQAEMEKIRGGWLKKDKDTDTEDYYLYTRDQQIQKIGEEELKRIYPEYKFNSQSSAWKQNEMLAKVAEKYFPKDESGEYRIFATGNMKDKKHEVLIPIHKDNDRKVKLDSDTVKRFFDVYEPTPDFDKFVKMLDEGDEIPVSYVPGNHGNDGIVAVGMGRMIRYPYQYNVEQLVEKQQSKYNDKRKDLAETIFGWVDKDDCMKGRVQVGNAFATKNIADKDLPKMEKGVLGTPRGSFYPFYILQEGDKYKTYEDAKGISGRKLYRIHSGGSTMNLPKGNGNENVGVTFRPIPAGQKFIMHINVHNLKKVEVGALLSAITMHKQSKVWHNIGLAKSFGFGKLHCESLKLHGFTCSEHEYIVAFEQQMNKFTQNEYNSKWLETKQNTYLFNIMSEHEDHDLEMMVLKEYTKAKRNKDKDLGNIFEILKKNKLIDYTSSKLHSVQTPEDLKKLADTMREEREQEQERKRKSEEEAKRKKQEQEAIRAKKEQEEAEKQFNSSHEADYKTIEELKKQNDLSSLNKAKSIVENLIRDREYNTPALNTKADKELLEKVKELIKKAKNSLSLSIYLDKTSGTNNKPIVSDWNKCKKQIEKWKKDAKVDKLDNEAKSALIHTIYRLKDNTKEKKDWENRNSRIWKEILKMQYLTSEEIDCVLTSE